MYSLKCFQITVVDDLGQEITPQNVNILTANTQTSATVYSDDSAAAFTNPVTAPTGPTQTFYSAAATLDIKIRTAYGNLLLRGVRPGPTTATIHRNLNKSQLLYALPDAGTSLVGNVVNQTRTASASFTIPANTLKEGDVIRVRGHMHATAQSGSITQKHDIGFGAAGEAITTGTATAVAAGNVSYFDMEFTCRLAGSGGKFIASGHYTKAPAAVDTAVPKPFCSITELSIDTTSAIIVGLYNTFGASALAGDTCRAEAFTVEILRA